MLKINYLGCCSKKRNGFIQNVYEITGISKTAKEIHKIINDEFYGITFNPRHSLIKKGKPRLSRHFITGNEVDAETLSALIKSLED